MTPRKPLPTITRTASARIPTASGEFYLCHYTNDIDGKEHLAIVMGEPAGREDVLVRVHSECYTGDVLGSLRCDCGEQLQRAMELVAQEGCGVIVYLRQEGRGIGLEAKLQAYNLQDEGYDTVEANLLLGHQADEREYWAAAGILADLQVASIRLMTNNPAKIEHLADLGVRVNDRLALLPSINQENAFYLDTKIRRMRHMLELSDSARMETNGTQAPAGGFRRRLALADTARLHALHTTALDHFGQTGRPFVTLSYAQTLDGSITAMRGTPTAISGDESRRLTHQIRAHHAAILVGVGTVLADDPRLDVRLVDGPSPAAVILDSHLRTPPSAQLFTPERPVWIVTTAAASEHAADRLEKQGAKLLYVDADAEGRPALPAALAALGEVGLASVMVEGGAEVISSFLAGALLDYAIITVAPRFLGGLNALVSLDSSCRASLPALSEVTYRPVGDDLVIWGAVKPAQATADRALVDRQSITRTANS